MKPVLFLAAAASVVSLAACDRTGAPSFGPAAALKPVSRLDCPDRQGSLKRVSASADGQACAYSDGDGAEVALQILRTSGDPHAALKPVEATLMSLTDLGPRPHAAAAPAAPNADPAASDAAAKAWSQASADAKASATASADSDSDEDGDGSRHGGHHRNGHDNENVSIDMPGLHVRTDNSDHARVNVMGFKVDASDDGAHVVREPKSGVGRRVVIDANDNGAIIRTEHIGRANFQSRVIYAADEAGAQGDRTVGYVAAGPKTGPLVVATMRIKRKDKGDTMEDVSRLVNRLSRG